MIMRNITQAKAELSALVERASKGEEIIISRAGKPAVKLIAYSGCGKRRTPGVMKGKIQIAPDFDTLPDDIADAFGVSGER
jgi:prevent-host-death family protein